MEDLINELYEIRKRPVLYFGNRKNLSMLANYISGFTMGRKGTNKEIEEDEYWFGYAEDSFQQFVMSNFNTTVSRHWDDIIEFHTASEDAAFELFYELLDKFIELKKNQ